MVLLVLLSAFFSMSETAFSSVSDVKLRVAIEERKGGAKKALSLYESFDKTLITLLIGNNLVNVALSTLAVLWFAYLIGNQDIQSLVSTVVVTIVLLIFGEIVPKMIAKRNPERIATRVAWLVYIISIILYPFVLFFLGIQKLLSKKNAEEESMQEDELEVAIDQMEDTGAIEHDEADLMRKTLDLNDRSVKDIMTPRVKMEVLDSRSTLEEVKEFMMDNAYSRIPVFKQDKDHMIGVLYVRDFFPALIKNPKLNWKRLIRPVKFVAATMKVDALIQEFQESKNHLAMVIGEYGEVIGLVTLEDAMEELFGEIYDEHDILGEDDLVFEKQEDGSYLVDADMFVDEAFEKLELGGLPDDIPAKLSGWLFEKCEDLPEVGYSFDYLAIYTMEDQETGEYKDYAKMVTLSVAEVKDRRISLVKITLRDATEEEIEQSKSQQEED
ncbi:MAG: hemolysin family protein [Acholeplasmatales bacterium]|nr:hemolysin family protein [Acholeplasmatales bacterium]